MRLAGRSIETPLPQRTWLQRFLVALTLGDSGRNLAEVEGCWRLHKIANLEREIYGEVVSDSAREHVEGVLREANAWGARLLPGGCHADWTIVRYH